VSVEIPLNSVDAFKSALKSLYFNKYFNHCSDDMWTENLWLHHS